MKHIATSSAFSPGHISGFVRARNNPLQPILRRGSEGAGISIERGVTTTVSVFDDYFFGSEIIVNGEKTLQAEVSELVLMQYFSLIKKPCYVKVEHQIDIPIGFGLGTSGAAALSLSYALNKCFGLGLSPEHAAQIAHYAEVACGTGLGTVSGEFAGGLEYRPVAGAPGIGMIRKFNLERLRAVILCSGPISTRKILRRYHDFGCSSSQHSVNTPVEIASVKDFLDRSYAFVSNRGLVDSISREIISKLSSCGFTSSIALFGRTIFTVVPKDEVQRAVNCLSGYHGQLITCGIDNIGARIL